MRKPAQTRVRRISTQGRGRDHDSRLVMKEIDHIALIRKMRAKFLTVEEKNNKDWEEEGGNNLVVLDWN